MSELERFIRRLDKKALAGEPVGIAELYRLVRAVQADYPAPKPETGEES